MKRSYFTCIRDGQQAVGLALFFLIMISCQQQPVQDTKDAPDGVGITEEQFEANHMQLASVSMLVMDSTVRCSGQLIPVKGGAVSISVPLSGVVRAVYVQDGQWVQEGQLLAEIGGNELIELQREMAVAAAEFERRHSEYRRLKVLYEQNAISEKEYQTNFSEFRMAQANYESLKLKIKMAGLSPAKIEAGEFFTAYPLKAQMSGQITDFTVRAGAAVESATLLGGIVDARKLQLKMEVHESDAGLVRRGQNVYFSVASEAGKLKASVSRIATGLSESSRTLQVFADIESTRPLLVNRMVECELIISSDSVPAVPDEALIKGDAGYQVLILDKKTNGTYYFKKSDVLIGRQMNGFVEIKGAPIEGDLLVKGAYPLQ
ncbi:MAG: efflux RND transporter periplasmic adaptor subunit [Bacteroidales bacterium]|nr:efflux RND transporter periplasmic adaptor subunit [Bacteroidales bacterium]